MSTLSICSIEDVASAVDKPFWFQLYVMKDRGFVRSLIERAAAAKCSALVLTVDLQVLGQRHCDVKNGLSVPPALKIKNLVNMASKPGWKDVEWIRSVWPGKLIIKGILDLDDAKLAAKTGAGGEAGVAKAIDILRKELDVSMALTGVKCIKDIGPRVLAQ
jgi:L-lactate dehydrogenase (cytochrome)